MSCSHWPWTGLWAWWPEFRQLKFYLILCATSGDSAFSAYRPQVQNKLTSQISVSVWDWMIYQACYRQWATNMPYSRGTKSGFHILPKTSHVCTGRIRQLWNKNALLSETAHSTPTSTQQHYLQKTDEAESCCPLKFSNSFCRKTDICHVKNWK